MFHIPQPDSRYLSDEGGDIYGPLTVHRPLELVGTPQGKGTHLNVFEVDSGYMHTPEKVTFTDKSGKVSGESTSDLGLMRVTTNYNPNNPKSGDERFIETVVGYAAPAANGTLPGEHPDPQHGRRVFQVGDQILNKSPTPNGYIGWVCTYQGEFRNAKWMPFGKIDA